MFNLSVNNKPVKKILTIAAAVILILLAAAVFFGVKNYFNLQKKLRASEESLKIFKTNDKVLNFSKLFINDVLRAKNDVDFETRLRLEQAVREIDDKEILDKWQKFIDSKTESEAQENVKNLLEILVYKIKI